MNPGLRRALKLFGGVGLAIALSLKLVPGRVSSAPVDAAAPWDGTEAQLFQR